VEEAKTNPELNFTVVGISDTLVERFELSKTLNLTCYSFLKHEELDNLYKKHQFHLCLSISEGFPNALCEGMSHGCVPVGSNVSSIPFIIDETGFILQKRDSEMLNELLNKVISCPPNQLKLMGESARNRIETEFNLERRKKAFYELIG
jgi:glycosyltransferase involved in cell wall biosynthesis